MAFRDNHILGNHDRVYSLNPINRPHRLITRKVIQGLVSNFGGLLGMCRFWLPLECELIIITSSPVIRIMLGVFEAGFVPGASYYISWYVHKVRYGSLDQED